MEKTALRKERIANIRLGLSTNPALTLTTNKLKDKMQRKQRRLSSQYTDVSTVIDSPENHECSDSDQSTTTSLFHEKYTLGEKAGEGAHGVVKQCFNKLTGKVYAVKTQTIERQQLLFLKKNFEEVKALKHPHVLTYKSLFFELKNARCYLIMDYVPFPDLT